MNLQISKNFAVEKIGGWGEWGCNNFPPLPPHLEREGMAAKIDISKILI